MMVEVDGMRFISQESNTKHLRGYGMKLKIKNKKLGLKIVFKANEYILSTLNEKGEILKILEYIERFKERSK